MNGLDIYNIQFVVHACLISNGCRASHKWWYLLIVTLMVVIPFSLHETRQEFIHCKSGYIQFYGSRCNCEQRPWKESDRYNKKPGFAYAVFRQICTAPCIYRSSGNEYFEDSSMPIDNKLPDDSFCGSLKRFDPSNKRRLPARIVLRPLASYKILFYIFIAYVILSLWQRSFVSSTVVLSLLYLLWLVAKAAVEYVCEVKTDEHKDNLVDMTLESTLLSPDNSYWG